LPDLGKTTGLIMDLTDKRDIHIVKYFSSFVSVSEGKVINITDPTLTFCPLASHLYKGFRGKRGSDKEAIKAAIKSAIESKIKDYGLFTGKRKFSCREVEVPYGASEMLSFALRKKAIDAAVVVCEGAGTVITDIPDIVRGIGGRMNSILLTSPIEGIIKKLKISGCRVIFENALVDQVRGVKEAIGSGYKTIAVTVCGHFADDLKALRLLEKESGVRIISLAVCTTGIAKDEVNLIRDYADLVWSCASQDVRRVIGPLAKCQLSKQIPVFVLTDNGVNFISAYAEDGSFIKSLDTKKQYIFSSERSGMRIRLGNFETFISESELPVNGQNTPRFEDKEEYTAV